MKSGVILIEALIFLILAFMLFSFVISVTSTLRNNQRFIEKGAQALSDVISVSSFNGTESIPSAFMNKLNTIDGTGGDILYEYKISTTGQSIKIRIGDN